MANPFRNPLARILAHRSPITDDTEKPPKKSQAAGGEGREKPPSILVAETTSMEHTRRAREQKGLRALIQVRVHAFSNPRLNRAIGHLLEHLNAAESTYPGTRLRLTYTLAGTAPAPEPRPQHLPRDQEV